MAELAKRGESGAASGIALGSPEALAVDAVVKLEKEVDELMRFALINCEAVRKILKKMCKNTQSFPFEKRVQEKLETMVVLKSNEVLVGLRNKVPPPPFSSRHPLLAPLPLPTHLLRSLSYFGQCA